jgi:outer membrane immunogenic protein
VRAEGQVGLTSFHSEGNSKSKIGYGAAAGVDFDLGGFVVGGEGTFWNARIENRGIDGPGLAEHKTFEEYGIALRAGVMATPATLVYGKIGYVRNEQRKRFTPLTGGVPNSAAPGYYYDHFKVNGIQYGAGIEQMLMSNFYAKAEGRYSDYKNHTHSITGLIGLGVLFGAAAPVEEVVPMAPPPAPVQEAPATQTCPDGSVILATSTCPPPPPPPPAPVERGERG